MEGRWAAIVVAAGRGERFGAPKQLIEIAGLPMAAWSMRAFASMPEIGGLIVATEPEWVDPMRALAAAHAPSLQARVVAGGATRQASVANALAAVAERYDRVLVHDGARPLVRAEDVRTAMALVGPGRAALLGTPAIDTIKVVDPHTRRVVRTLERTTIWAAQTPQLATLADLRRAHRAAQGDAIVATDDAMLLERIEVRVQFVPASNENLKVTHPDDRERAERLLRERSAAS